jgi:hypothetical protein
MVATPLREVNRIDRKWIAVAQQVKAFEKIGAFRGLVPTILVLTFRIL